MGDGPVAVRGQEEHLGLPGIRAERPAVAEDDRLSGAPILEVDEDIKPRPCIKSIQFLENTNFL